ncbi:hypothetical protein GCM10010307_64100 [Streptomyces vastus]|uniref:Uncharacterized protein n=1 Tax=Streptomyces vastus TaxID=285451 RepID=A0ABP6DU97_9ACTN
MTYGSERAGVWSGGGKGQMDEALRAALLAALAEGAGGEPGRRLVEELVRAWHRTRVPPRKCLPRRLPSPPAGGGAVEPREKRQEHTALW